jgi:hypothetical protein
MVPLLTYVGVTVIAPALNGATRRDGFWEHAALTVGVSGLMTWIWLFTRRHRGPESQNLSENSQFRAGIHAQSQRKL